MLFNKGLLCNMGEKIKAHLPDFNPSISHCAATNDFLQGSTARNSIYNRWAVLNWKK